ncbi:mRNA turnover protein 4 homolog [Phlebotomus argentipes]|uniref:mRNA turnover protein 4 homolog n=1 Tax=Phlebotomus argentipes TaxID=94469 RepID=UPI0028936EF0|nr:mRNA turnover protein 4 homolog [Phlebotomus argentipes]
MPKSKRDQKISLTKTDRKGLAWKQHIVEDIRHCVSKYSHIYVFSVHNMRNTLLKELRTQWKDSRFFFGKNRIMQMGLGEAAKELTEDVRDNLLKLSHRLHGQCGLLFTNHGKDVVLDWFKDYSALEYARSGHKCHEAIVLPAGPCEEFSHAIEPHLRKLGLPTKLDKGVVSLYQEYRVCEAGSILTPEQAKILKLCNMPIATFKLLIKCLWLKTGGFENLLDDTDTSDSGNGADDEMERNAEAAMEEDEED